MWTGWRKAQVTWRAAIMGAALFTLLVMATAAQARKVTSEDVLIRTEDGTAEAVLHYPAMKGKWPSVILWPDAVGIRPIFRDVARKLAAEGYVVLLPNSFYRTMRPGDAELNPFDPKVRPLLMAHRTTATPEGIKRDAAAYLAYLDGRRETDRRKMAGTIGYDLGASYAVLTAVALPKRVAAVGSVYGVAVATVRPDSPHLLVPKTRASYYIAIAKDADAREPEDKDDLRAVLRQGNLEGTVEVYPADHGWANPAGRTYDREAAERAFRALVDLLKAKLG